MARLWDAIRASSARGGAAVPITACSRRDRRVTRVTVWQPVSPASGSSDEPVRAVYPDGIHAAIAAGLRAEAGLDVRTATLDEPSTRVSTGRLLLQRDRNAPTPAGRHVAH